MESFKNKHGTQREREVVFRAIHAGWHKDMIGSHIVRNNTIFNCEQTGICGHMGCAFSVIENNTIFDIHTKHLFEGAEIGGIKLHAAIDTLVRNNRLINCFRGLWLDWQAQGTRVSQNLFAKNNQEDLFIEVSHGPCVVDNNIFLSRTNLRDFSQGGAFLHNLFTGKFLVGKVPNRFTHYHFPHETAVMGLMTVLGGDNRFYNNVFAKLDTESEVGLFYYNEYPTPYDADKQYDNIKLVPAYAEVSLAMYCGNNLYLNGAKSFKAEVNSVVENEFATVSIRHNEDIVLTTDFGKYLSNVQCTEKINTQHLGIAFQPEVGYENSDGSPLSIDYDYFGNKIKDTNPLPGPFANLQEGMIEIKL